MKKKLLSNTYLNEAEKYQIKFFLDEEDKYVVIKKLIKLSKPFIIKNNVTAMDNGYYVIEIVPKNKNYALRIFLNDKKEEFSLKPEINTYISWKNIKSKILGIYISIIWRV